MPYYYYGFDWTYLVIVLPCIILSLLASASVNSTFKKYSKQLSARHITGAQAAQRVLSANGVIGVRIDRVSGNLTDHFDPKANVIRLSDNVYNSTSTAAIGVACHEAGHAVQYAQNYFPIRVRAVIIPITNIGSRLAMPLILLGILFSTLGGVFESLINVGIACFSLSLVFQLVTLPVEYNASKRATQILHQSGILTKEETQEAKEVLNSAALTYVAALVVSILNLLRLLLSVRSRD
jgi:Zn-dependent membrane protease YugP